MSKLVSKVNTNDVTDELSKSFDYTFDGVTEFVVPEISTLDWNSTIESGFGIGLIVGPSGTGKSTMLKSFGSEEEISWDPNEAVCSHFEDADDAKQRLSAVGFNSIPSWMKPFHVLSNGEQFRANLARRLKDNAVIDEFTSVVDRNVAKSCAYATRRYIDAKQLKNVVFATCHYDIIEWLQPDWVFDTSTGDITTRGSLRPPTIELEVLPCSTEIWSKFSHHHYLTGDINKSARCWLAIWNGVPVGFSAVISFPSGTVRNGYRGHRTVILPDFQGLGLGVRLSDAIGEIHIQEGKRFFSKTAHPRLGEYREASSKWRPTAHNKQNRHDYDRLAAGNHLPNPRRNTENKHSVELMDKHRDRVCYAHEYIGV